MSYKIKIIILLFSLVLGIASEGRIQSGVRFDPETGNYIIQYPSYDTNDTITVIYEPPTKIEPNAKAVVEFNGGGVTLITMKCLMTQRVSREFQILR